MTDQPKMEEIKPGKWSCPECDEVIVADHQPGHECIVQPELIVHSPHMSDLEAAFVLIITAVVLVYLWAAHELPSTVTRVPYESEVVR